MPVAAPARGGCVRTAIKVAALGQVGDVGEEYERPRGLGPAGARGSPVTVHLGERRLIEPIAGPLPAQPELVLMSSRPEESHLWALPDPYVNLSIHTAPDVRPFPWQSCQ